MLAVIAAGSMSLFGTLLAGDRVQRDTLFSDKSKYIRTIKTSLHDGGKSKELDVMPAASTQ